MILYKLRSDLNYRTLHFYKAITILIQYINLIININIASISNMKNKSRTWVRSSIDIKRKGKSYT